MFEGISQDRDHRRIAFWLLSCCALVYAMVVLGGVTRLTGSGLSIVDWRPLMGWLPPMSDAAWQASFDLYRQSPEYQLVNAGFGLEGYKSIFWLEYLHRLLGRTIGLVFLLPFLFFVWSGAIGRRDIPKYLLMFVLGGLQGLLGWYMVKSGLVDDPRVSQYRLTAHLMAAFLIYAYLFWVSMSLLFRGTDGARHGAYRRTVALAALIVITVVSGGFVAGLDAGLAFNSFPLMGGQLIPDGLWALEPAIRNPFENLITVQFNHRVLSITTLLSVIAYWFTIRGTEIPSRIRPAIHLLLGVVLLQASLGIATLLLHVPVVLASMHQAVALLLFTVALYLVHGLRGAR